jgi:hypothetical protein
VAMWSGSEYPDVENNAVRACRSIVHIACTRCTETIRMKNKEEMRLLLRVIQVCRRRQCAAAEIHRRGMVH